MITNVEESEGSYRWATRALAGLRNHPIAADIAVVGLLAVISVPDVLSTPSPIKLVLVDVGLIAPLILRRRQPSVVFAVVAVVAFVEWVINARADMSNFALLVALYTVAGLQSRRRTVLAVAIMELGAVLATLRWASLTPRPAIVLFVLVSGMVIASAILGIYVRTRRAYLATLQDRAERAERERDQQAQLAVIEERSRITREIHDIVTHNISVMIALADGAIYAHSQTPDEAVQAMGLVSSTGRNALAEMRKLLGVLRDVDVAPSLVPQPGIRDLDDLIAQVRAAGLPVTLRVTGQPAPLARGLQVNIYRMIQEGLTNTLKHGGPEAAAQVRLDYQPTSIDVVVSDTGEPSDQTRTSNADGQGLIGMRERATLQGGTLHAATRRGGGWEVRAHLPIDPARGQTEVATHR